MSLLTRILGGAAIGGVANYAMSDNVTSTGLARDVIGGALFGGGVGAMTARRLWTSAPKGAGYFKSAIGVPGGVVPGLGIGLGKMAGIGAIKTAPALARTGLAGAFALGTFVMKNPKTALGLTGLGIGAYALTTSGPGEPNLTADDMAAIAVAQGGPSTGHIRNAGRAAFMNSTNGLVQGLSAGRHK